MYLSRDYYGFYLCRQQASIGWLMLYTLRNKDGGFHRTKLCNHLMLRTGCVSHKAAKRTLDDLVFPNVGKRVRIYHQMALRFAAHTFGDDTMATGYFLLQFTH